MRVSLASLFSVPLLTYANVVNITLLATASQSHLLLSRSAHHRLYRSDELIFPQGLVPGGEFVILPPSNSSNYTLWIAEVLEGTNMLFFMTDSLGRQGGVSDVLVVADSTDASCLVAGAVSSTVSAPSQPTSNQSILPVSNTPNAGVIAGATVGSVVFLALLITLGVCWRRKALRSSRVTDKVDSYEVKRDYQVQQNFQSKNQTDHQPLGPSHLANVFTSDPFSQHLRQMSYADSSVGSSSVAGTGQISPNTFVSQTSPIHPGTQSHAANVSAGGVAVNDPYAPFSQTQPSRQTSDPVAEYGDVGNSSPMSAANRRMAAMAVQSASPNYAFPYQTTPVSHVAPPGTLPHHTSPGSTTVSGPPSPINQAQPLSLSSNMERFARPVDAGNPPPGRGIAALADQTATDGSTEYILHTDVEDVQVARDAKKVVELPPQYADRQLPDSQPTLAPSSEC
jgi:hypothetical protein